MLPGLQDGVTLNVPCHAVSGAWDGFGEDQNIGFSGLALAVSSGCLCALALAVPLHLALQFRWAHALTVSASLGAAASVKADLC